MNRTEVLKTIIEISQENLHAPSGQQVLFYLMEERQLSKETIEKFSLGAFPDSFSRVERFIGEQNLIMLGIKQTFSEHHKVIVPIYNQYNEPIAIMGRCLHSEEDRSVLQLSKYNNSIYPKSMNLFGLNLAKQEILEKNKVLVVEGNFDVISCHQYGKTYAVGISSTSLSKKQYTLLSRYTSNISVMLDRDEAGQEAQERIRKQYPEIHFPVLHSDFKDVDEFFRVRRRIAKV